MKEASAEHTFESLAVGQEARFERLVSEADIETFARLSGDYNPLHVDAAYAATTAFGKPVAHGMLLGSFVSRLVGMYLPGRYALFVKETLEFRNPVFAEDTLVIVGRIARKSEAVRLVEIAIEMRCGDVLVVSGTAYVKVLK